MKVILAGSSYSVVYRPHIFFKARLPRRILAACKLSTPGVDYSNLLRWMTQECPKLTYIDEDIRTTF